MASLLLDLYDNLRFLRVKAGKYRKSLKECWHMLRAILQRGYEQESLDLRYAYFFVRDHMSDIVFAVVIVVMCLLLLSIVKKSHIKNE